MFLKYFAFAFEKSLYFYGFLGTTLYLTIFKNIFSRPSVVMKLGKSGLGEKQWLTADSLWRQRAK